MKNDFLKIITRISSVMIFLLLCSAIFAQTTITGKVTDAKDGSALNGVTVTVKGSSTATQTNNSGNFSISAPGGSTLVFSSVNYDSQEQEVANRPAVNVQLTATAGKLNEVVVIGYGTSRKKDLTGSVAQVSSKDFQTGQITSPDQLIAGKVAGVQVTSNSGAPGAGSTIRIRGGASLNASNDPLIVIDGVPVDNGGISGSANALSLINPNDIESMSILKDASATAIYGSRASNGVLIINTKKGRTGEPVINFNTTYSLSKITDKVDVLSADQFRAFVNANGTAAQAALLGTASTNWQNEIYQTAKTSDNNISVSGGYKKMPYRYSLGYLNQQGVLKAGKLERYSFGANLSPRLLNDNLRIDLNFKASISENRFANEGAIGAAVNFDPTKPVYSGNKRFGGFYEWLDSTTSTGLKSLAPLNPVGLLLQRNDRSEVRRSIGNAQIDYRLPFFKDLHVNVNVGYDVSTGLGTIFVPDSAASAYNRLNPAGTSQFFGGINNKYLQKKSNTLLEAFLNYAKDIKSIQSRVDIVAGYAYQDFLTTNNNYPDLTVSNRAVTSPKFPFDKPEYTLISYYGRANFNINSKYLFTGTIRTDGSSRFIKRNRWGVFPSGAFAWNIKNEDFIRNSSAISDLKLRLGYGITGQQEGIPYYDYISYYNLSENVARYQFGDQFYNLYAPAGYYEDRKWEQTETYNAGFDYGFFNNRLSGNIDVYFKKTKDLLNQIGQPAGANFSNKIIANVGNMENKGIELSINVQPVKNNAVTWDVNFNATYNENKITKLTIAPDPKYPGNPYGDISGGVGSQILINTVGYNRGSFYVYQQVYDNAGNPVENVFVDRNKDGVINGSDLYQYQKADPNYLLGLSSSVSVKKFNLGFVMRANLDNYVYNNVYSSTGVTRNILNPIGILSNGSINVLETNFTGSGDKSLLSDYYIQNGSFLRMDNAFAGYNFGSVFSNTATLGLNFNVQNVFVVTNYKGLDPEISSGIDNNFYPRPRIYSLGLNLRFK